MIMKAEELSQEQKTAVELLLSREVFAAERITLLASHSSVPTEADVKLLTITSSTFSAGLAIPNQT
jgi:hypothetical protein